MVAFSAEIVNFPAGRQPEGGPATRQVGAGLPPADRGVEALARSTEQPGSASQVFFLDKLLEPGNLRDPQWAVGDSIGA